MKKQKINFIVATIFGLATLAPMLVNAQSANVQISGTVSGGNSVQMMRGDFKRGGRMNGRGMMPGAVGKVTAISGNTITITENSKIITIDATNAVILKDNSTSSISAVAVGDLVFAQGTLTGTNLVATKIHDGIKGMMGGAMLQLQGNGQPVVAGNISTISGNTVTITNKSNVSYTIDATNAKVIVKNATSSISGLVTGDMIVAQGTVNGNAVVATTIIDQGTPGAMDSGQGSAIPGIFVGISGFFSHLFGF